jgi:hypothetical protein
MTDKSKYRREGALLASLVIFHAWGFWLIITPSQYGAEMFSTTCFGIFSTLGILAGEKVLRILVELKWGSKGPTQ